MSLSFSSYFSSGPTPKLTLFHIWKAYQVIDTAGPVGRKALADICRSAKAASAPSSTR